MNQINLNGKFLNADETVLLASNRGYRYGDGIFETMKVINHRIQLQVFHFERLLASLSLLKIVPPNHFSTDKLMSEILALCEKNNCEELGRIRLSVSSGNGGLYDSAREMQYLIEAWPLDEAANRLNENGLAIGVFRDSKKSTDQFSNLKSANFLPYTMAAVFAKENKLNDCLVLNQTGQIADSTIANLFIIRGHQITTPPLSEGCVNGVMRRFLMENLKSWGYPVIEASVSIDDLLRAEEMFLTNAINGIRWVKAFEEKSYSNLKISDIYHHLMKTIS